MRLFDYKFLPLVFCLALVGCSDNETSEVPNPENDEDIPEVSVDKIVSVDPTVKYQTIRGFGASDCWSPNYVGKYWTNHRDAITELLFSSEIVDGQPKGIGLSQWRVNLGAGSAEQGDASGIEDESRRAESYMTENGTYDWNKCEGQRYFMNRAKEMGVPDFILFSNSPLVQYTKNGKGFSNSGMNTNLKDDCYDDYAKYMADVAKHYTDDGYNITHISPVNEPQYNWDGGQEGSGWTNDQVARLARELDANLTANGLSNTDILLGEAGDWEYLYKVKNEQERSDVISAFFTPGSSAYVGDLQHVNNLICGHSYWTDGTWDGMRQVRLNVHNKAIASGLELWQSEWSMLGDGYSSSEFVGYDAATEMDIALYMSRVIHNDLTVAQVSSWCYWTSIDVTRWAPHKNRFLLISLVPQGGAETGDIKDEGSFNAAPTLWVLGNYSRFIRPGYVRVDLSMNESMNFFGSAWISPEGDKIVAVYTNYSDKAVKLIDGREGWDSQPTSVMIYTSSSSKHLKKRIVPEDGDIYVDAKSVTTVVYELK